MKKEKLWKRSVRLQLKLADIEKVGKIRSLKLVELNGDSEKMTSITSPATMVVRNCFRLQRLDLSMMGKMSATLFPG